MYPKLAFVEQRIAEEIIDEEDAKLRKVNLQKRRVMRYTNAVAMALK